MPPNPKPNQSPSAIDDLEDAEIWGDTPDKGPGKKDDMVGQKRSSEESIDSVLEDEARHTSTGELRQLISLLDNDIRVMKSDLQMIQYKSEEQRKKIRQNEEKVKINVQPPLLVSHIVEILDPEDDDGQNGKEPDDGAAVDSTSQYKGRSAVIKTSTRQTIFLPIPGLVDTKELRPKDLVGCNKDSYLILEKLPDEYDRRVKAFEVEDRPLESYADIAGCDKQIQELIEAVVLPMTHKDMFEAVGIQPPKGVLLHGPPGTGKTLLARACANQTDAAFFKLAGPELVQMYIGDGAKMVRDAFDFAKEKLQGGEAEGAIMFIDEIDAIGTKRYGGDQSGEREVQRTMLELLNQLDGFAPNDMIKVIAATNRPDILDPALLRSGRLDRKIELPMPTEDARIKIFKIHSRKMHLSDGVVFEELARTCEDFNGAQIKAVCVEAGMLALRREAPEVGHEDYVDAITVVAAKRKGALDYYA
eukprot:CAMPEP_0197444094 /NCGR_PEP_ID=MMETSP1175-20131217/9664_1 /TAXON_ID=1003142 /ORGANISM="Triceratium dubium, Strain CCMP147" /LENGTH=473 /DNA_ID=CAMNT_0042974819 /DNA_START=148 /DNA_END=1569 /DNA_ORIENTATION=+